MVGSTDLVVGTDVDETKKALARQEAAALQLTNVEFRVADIQLGQSEPEFDLVHARFLLTHLPDPQAALTNMSRALRPGGVIILVDIDFRGYFSHPDSPALSRYVDLYTRTVERRGG